MIIKALMVQLYVRLPDKTRTLGTDLWFSSIASLIFPNEIFSR